MADCLNIMDINLTCIDNTNNSTQLTLGEEYVIVDLNPLLGNVQVAANDKLLWCNEKSFKKIINKENI